MREVNGADKRNFPGPISETLESHEHGTSFFILDNPAADDDAGGIWSTDDEYMDGRRSFRLLVRTGQLVSGRRARKRQRPRVSRWLAARRHGEHQRFNRQLLPLNQVS